MTMYPANGTGLEEVPLTDKDVSLLTGNIAQEADLVCSKATAMQLRRKLSRISNKMGVDKAYLIGAIAQDRKAFELFRREALSMTH